MLSLCALTMYPHCTVQPTPRAISHAQSYPLPFFYTLQYAFEEGMKSVKKPDESLTKIVNNLIYCIRSQE